MADRNREWIWGATALVAIIAVVLVLAPPPRQLATDQRLSTLRTTPDGAGAVYAVLRELGIPVDQRMTPLAGVEPVRGPLAILQPTEAPTPAELDSLFAWVEAGGRLILASPGPQMTERLGVAMGSVPADNRSMTTTRHPWTAGMDSLGFAYRAFRRDTLRGDELLPLVETADGSAAVALLPSGEGEVLLISHGSDLSNQWVREEGMMPIVTRAAAEWTAAGDTLWFDEYHHGHRGGGPVRGLGAFLGHAGPGRMALQLALVGLLALVPAAVRFGSATERPPPPRRSRLEHVAALGEVYRQAGAEDVARRRLVGGFARRIGRERPSPGQELAFLERLERNVTTGADATRAVSEAWRERRPVLELARRIDEAVTRLNQNR